MSAELDRLRTRQQARKTIEQMHAQSSHHLVIHYSCESFYDRADGRTPRITSIAVRNLRSGQTESFSIRKVAEVAGTEPGQIPQEYDRHEKVMLDEFFEYMRRHEGFKFVHWNMRDINFGFQALEHRHRVLGGEPFVLPEDRKIDLARLFVDLFGRRYAPHQSASGKKGRIFSLAELNGVTLQDAEQGAEEAGDFEIGNYVRLHQSTLRKVDVFSNFFERAHDRSLKTSAEWMDTHGAHPKVVVDLVTEHWLWTLVVIAATIYGFFVKDLMIKLSYRRCRDQRHLFGDVKYL